MKAITKTITKTIKKIGVSLSVVLMGIVLTACGESSKKKAEKKIFKEIRDVVTTTMRADQSPGMAVALVHNNKLVFSEGFGVSNSETQQAVTADTSFWLGSVSKTAIAVSIMHAQENGLLSLEDNVNTILNSDNDISLSTPFVEPVLLKHLTSHTSSIIDSDAYICAYFVGDEDAQNFSLANQLLDDSICDETAPVTLKGYLNAYLSEEGEFYSAQSNFLTFNPGTHFEYSNVGAALAGLTLEIATGTSLADYAQTHIFEPLHMDNTSWRLNGLEFNNIATPYRWDEENKELAALPIYSLSTWPDAGLRSSANDLASYLMMVMNKGQISTSSGNSRILSVESVANMFPLDPVNINDETTGVFWTKLKLPSGRIVIGHNGSDPGAYSYIYYDPIQQTGVVLVANGDDEIDEDNFGKRHYDGLINTLLNHAKSLGN